MTAPVNRASVRFHQQMGFDIEPGDREVDGIPVRSDYDGNGNDRVRFVKHLDRTILVPAAEQSHPAGQLPAETACTSTSFTIFEGTSETQRMITGRAVTELNVR